MTVFFLRLFQLTVLPVFLIEAYSPLLGILKGAGLSTRRKFSSKKFLNVVDKLAKLFMAHFPLAEVFYTL